MVNSLQKHAIYEDFKVNKEELSELYIEKILLDYQNNEDSSYEESFTQITEYLKKFPNYEVQPTNEESSFVSQMLYNHDQLLKYLHTTQPPKDSLYIAHIFTILLNTTNFKDKQAIIDMFDLLKETLTPDEITAFLSSQIREENKDLIQILLRYNQLTRIRYKDSGIKKTENLSLAIGMEKKFFSIQRTKNRYLKKDNFIPRTVHYDASQKITSVFLKNHGNQKLCKTGISKKVTVAMIVPDDRTISPTIIAQAVNKTSSINKIPMTTLKNSALRRIYENINGIEKEILLHKLFSGNTGIWPILSSFEYKKLSVEKGYVIPKISFLMPMAISDIAKFCEGAPITTLDDLIECFDIAKQLTAGLNLMHTSGYIHGDLKPENALFAYLENGKIVAGLSDFGSTFKANSSKKLPYPFNEGSYGSPFSTAPELFGSKNFNKDLFKIDIWALGYLFHLLFLKKDLKFSDILCKQENFPANAVSPETKKEMFGLIIKEIEKPREAIVKKENRSLLEDFTLLIYDMMRFDPSKRPNIQQVAERLELLEQNILTASFNAISLEEQCVVA